MKKETKVKKLQARNILKFVDIRQTPQSEPEPQQKLEGTIQMGKRDEIIEKVISEANEE